VSASEGTGSPRLSRQDLPRAVLELCERLQRAGHGCWVVGGSVRDSLGVQLAGGDARAVWHAKDWDLATDASPEQVMQLFRKVIPTGIEHGTVTVLLHGLNLEVTTLRADRSYSDGRRPERIEFVSSIDEDLARRDFTVNAIAFEPRTETLIDPFGGIADLRAKRLRAVGEASQRFAEDGLRVLRAARLVATLDFELEPATAAAIRPSLDTYRKVSAERIRDEWNKALGARAPSRAFRAMHEHGLLAITAPALDALAAQPAAHGPQPGSAFARSLTRMDLCPRQPELRLAALLRDLDAAPARAADPSESLLSELRYSNAERKQVTHLVRHPLPRPPELCAAPSLRRWLRRIGPEHHTDACALARAELHARGASAAELEELDALERRATALLSENPPLSLGALAVDGKVLIREAGFQPSRQLGAVLETLLEQVIDEPALNTREKLLDLARALRDRT
jgi:tRNA nucleotidyltransferase (CCA-adding enzyme)